jgi:hypothetical protein
MLSSLLALLFMASDPAASLRCDGRLVAVEDWDFQLRQTCGEPFHVDRWSELLSQSTGPDSALARRIDYEDWFFDFGSNRFLQRVRLRDGRVVRIDALSLRGRNQPLQVCRGGDLRTGLTSGELLRLCGPPLRREELEEAQRFGQPPADSWVPTRQERWIYPLPNGRLSILSLRRGVLQRIELE